MSGLEALAVDQIAAQALHDRREAVGEPLAHAVVELHVERERHAGRLELAQYVLKLRQRPGLADLARDTGPDLLQPLALAPQRQTGIELPQAVEPVVVGALALERGQQFGVGNLLQLREAVQRNDLLGPRVVVDVGAVEIEQTGQLVRQGGGIDLIVVAAFGQADQLNADVLMRLIEGGHGVAIGLGFRSGPGMDPHRHNGLRMGSGRAEQNCDGQREAGRAKAGTVD